MTSVNQIALDYPITPTHRWGHGKPAHERLLQIMEAHRDRYAEHLRAILGCAGALKSIPLEPRDPSQPAWGNPWFSGLDLAALHMFVATHRPARYLEVGSGWSTTVARHAARSANHDLCITSIDPAPRAEIDRLCNRVVRRPVEQVDPAIFDELDAGDILFIDDSHRIFTNSDTVVLFLEVLPRLRPGVLVHVHDIYLPYDYPPEWTMRFYSEQYLLAAWLLAEGPHIRIELPNMFVSCDSELSTLIGPLWTDELSNVQRHGGSFWFRAVDSRHEGSETSRTVARAVTRSSSP